MELSAKGQEFIDNLQLYLMASGKKETEINKRDYVSTTE